MLLPGRTAVERLERPFARPHVAEPPQPNKAVWIIEVPELAQHLHADLFLRLDKLAVEESDQGLARARTEGIAAELDNAAALTAHA